MVLALLRRSTRMGVWETVRPHHNEKRIMTVIVQPQTKRKQENVMPRDKVPGRTKTHPVTSSNYPANGGFQDPP